MVFKNVVDNRGIRKKIDSSENTELGMRKDEAIEPSLTF